MSKYQEALNKLQAVCLSIPSTGQGEEMGFSPDFDFDHDGYGVTVVVKVCRDKLTKELNSNG